MRRREFGKLMAAAAASAALPLQAQTSGSVSGDVPAGFDQLTQEFAQFCSRPNHERVFYALVRGRIVPQLLEAAAWHATSWGYPRRCRFREGRGTASR
jgi:hypothetical protein